jgi:putative ABC transport system permease protein
VVPLIRRMVWNERSRFGITACGVSVLVMLMCFLGEIYNGVKSGCTHYIRQSPAEIWVCQKNSTNLLRSSSFLDVSIGETLMNARGVKAETALLRVLTTARIDGKAVTLFLFGFDPNSALGVPQSVVKGTSVIKSGEVILDASFSRKYKMNIGDSILIQERPFRIAGISEGTNAVVAQFAFSTLEDARELLGFPNTLSFCLLSPDGGIKREDLMNDLKRNFPGLAIFSKDEFIRNTLDEMRTGVLPILWTIAVLGCIAGGAVMMLMLYGSVLEKREDYALLKAIGAGPAFLGFLVIRLSLACSLTGFALGFALNMLLNPLLTGMVPELSLSFSWTGFFLVLSASVLIGVLGSWLSIRKILQVGPAEVFRA